MWQRMLDNVPELRTCKLAKRLQVSHISVATRAFGKMGSPQLGTENASPKHQAPQMSYAANLCILAGKSKHFTLILWGHLQK